MYFHHLTACRNAKMAVATRSVKLIPHPPVCHRRTGLHPPSRAAPPRPFPLWKPPAPPNPPIGAAAATESIAAAPLQRGTALPRPFSARFGRRHDATALPPEELHRLARHALACIRPIIGQDHEGRCALLARHVGRARHRRPHLRQGLWAPRAAKVPLELPGDRQLGRRGVHQP